jgi:hypothetical protein
LNDGRVVVEILNRGRIKTIVHADGQVNVAWLRDRRRGATDFRAANVLGWNDLLAELAGDVASISEVTSNDNDVSTACSWALRRVGIEEEWWLVVMVQRTVFSAICCVQSDFNSSLAVVI